MTELERRGHLLPVPRRRRFSLRVRVALAIAAVAIAPLFLVFLWSQVDKPVRERTSTRAARAAERAVSLVASREVLPVRELERIAKDERVRLRVYAEDGRARVDVDADRPWDAFNPVEAFFLGEKDHPSTSEVDRGLGAPPTREGYVRAVREGSDARCGTDPVTVCQAARRASSTHGRWIVHAQASSYRAVEEVYALRHQLGRLMWILAPLAILLALTTSSRVVGPIEGLQRQALEQAHAESPGALLDARSPDEVGVLADAFNVLLVALEAKRRENQVFVADLVHELKNPIAAVRAVAESLEDSPPDAARAARLARALAESTQKLDRVATQFLELARAEAGMPNEERVRVDLAALVRALVEGLRHDERHASVTFGLEGASTAEALVLGVPFRLEAVVSELLENAASFAGESGSVKASVAVSAERVVLSVRDSGPGIPEADLGRVFDRFYTTRGARRGTGLGLALVKAVAEAHGGTVSARNDGGAVLELRLPRAT